MQHPIGVSKVSFVGCAIVPAGQERQLTISSHWWMCRVSMLDELNQNRIEAPGAPIVEVELYIVTPQLGDQRPRGVPLNEGWFSGRILKIALARPNGERKSRRASDKAHRIPGRGRIIRGRAGVG